VREIRTHGSEGGAAQTNASSLPLSNLLMTELILRPLGLEILKLYIFISECPVGTVKNRPSPVEARSSLTSCS